MLLAAPVAGRLIAAQAAEALALIPGCFAGCRLSKLVEEWSCYWSDPVLQAASVWRWAPLVDSGDGKAGMCSLPSLVLLKLQAPAVLHCS